MNIFKKTKAYFSNKTEIEKLLSFCYKNKIPFNYYPQINQISIHGYSKMVIVCIKERKSLNNSYNINIDDNVDTIIKKLLSWQRKQE